MINYKSQLPSVSHLNKCYWDFTETMYIVRGKKSDIIFEIIEEKKQLRLFHNFVFCNIYLIIYLMQIRIRKLMVSNL